MPIQTRNLDGDLVDLVGIEPTTSSMPFLMLDCSRARLLIVQRQIVQGSAGVGGLGARARSGSEKNEQMRAEWRATRFWRLPESSWCNGDVTPTTAYLCQRCGGVVDFFEIYSFARNRRSRWGVLRGCPVLSSHFSPHAAPQVGQQTASICSGVILDIGGQMMMRNNEKKWSILNSGGVVCAMAMLRQSAKT